METFILAVSILAIPFVILILLPIFLINLWCTFVFILLLFDGTFGKLLDSQFKREKFKDYVEKKDKFKIIQGGGSSDKSISEVDNKDSAD